MSRFQAKRRNRSSVDNSSRSLITWILIWINVNIDHGRDCPRWTMATGKGVASHTMTAARIDTTRKANVSHIEFTPIAKAQHGIYIRNLSAFFPDPPTPQAVLIL